MTPRPWMAHPRKHDDLRLIAQAIVGFLVLLAACVVVPVVGS